MSNNSKKGFIGYFIFILILMLVGSISKYLTFLVIIFSAILIIILSNTFVKRPSVDMCKGIMLLLMLQNFSIGIGAHIASNTDSTIKYITQIPFMTIFIIWFFLEVNTNKHSKKDKSRKFFYILLFCIFFSIIIGRGNILSMLINIRNMTTFYMAYIIGKHAINSFDDLNIFIRFLVKLAIVFLFFGIILLILGYDGYKVIGIKEVYLAKGVSLNRDALDGRFYTTLISKQYMRMGSLLYEPVNLAYFYASVSILTIFCDWTKNKNEKIIVSFLCIIGLILTFGKGGYMILGISIGAYFLKILMKTIFNRINNKSIFRLSVICMIIAVTAFCIYYYRNIGAAVNPHFWGIQRTWKSVLAKPYGYGLGTGGNAAQTFNSSAGSWLDTGGETALMSFMYQIGIQGVLALALCLTNMISSDISSNSKNNRIFIVFNYIPFVILGVSLLQDNTFTPQCIVIYMFVLGALKNLKEKQ